jgi:anti-sigma factor RsiW
MVINCKDLWQEISSYIDNDVSAELRAELEDHLAHCRHCAALVDSTRNILVLIADERVFSLPAGFSARLHERLCREIEGQNR